MSISGDEEGDRPVGENAAASHRGRPTSIVLPDLKRLRLEGKTMDEIAEWLNDHGHLTTARHPI